MTVSWKDFVEAFDAQFFLESFQMKMRGDFMHISQGDLTIMEYTGHFNQLSRFAKIFMTNEKERAKHFQSQLQSNIRSRLASLVLTTYEDDFEQVIKVEQDYLEPNT